MWTALATRLAATWAPTRSQLPASSLPLTLALRAQSGACCAQLRRQQPLTLALRAQSGACGARLRRKQLSTAAAAMAEGAFVATSLTEGGLGVVTLQRDRALNAFSIGAHLP